MERLGRAIIDAPLLGGLAGRGVGPAAAAAAAAAARRHVVALPQAADDAVDVGRSGVHLQKMQKLKNLQNIRNCNRWGIGGFEGFRGWGVGRIAQWDGAVRKRRCGTVQGGAGQSGTVRDGAGRCGTGWWGDARLFLSSGQHSEGAVPVDDRHGARGFLDLMRSLERSRSARSLVRFPVRSPVLRSVR